jgi:hypothetical protein
VANRDFGSDRKGGGNEQAADGREEGTSSGRDPRQLAMQRRWVQRKAAGRKSKDAAVPSGDGTPLDKATQARLQPHVGGDLSQVRVHTGADSATAAKDFGARAFTVGKDVHFGAGEHAPGTREGDRLLAHELTHAVEGGSAPIARKADEGDAAPAEGEKKAAKPGKGEKKDEAGAAEVSHPDDPAEKKADAKGDEAAEALHDKPPSPDEEEFNKLTANSCIGEGKKIDPAKLSAWQEQNGLPPTGKVDGATLEAARSAKKGKAKGKDGDKKEGAEKGDKKGDKLAGLGDEAQALNPEAKAAGEKSLGADLGDVKVHKGEKSGAAAGDMGAKAFTHGQDIVLGEGEENSLNPVMAHEMAHTAQQKGGAPGVAQKSNRVAQGSSHEVDADHAAAAIMQGRSTKLATKGAEQIACFEGGEHMQLGTEGFAAAGMDGPLTVGGVKAEAGLFTALQGDFYGGSWDDLEQDCNEKPQGVYKLLDVLKNEQGQRAKHYADPAHNKEPDSDGAIIIAEMGLRAKYLTYASDNAAHFGEKSEDSEKKFEQLEGDNPAYAPEIAFAQGAFGANVAEYIRLHIDALKRGFSDAIGGKGPDCALAMDAGANHFLTDAFASGHMRTPRDAMMKEYHAVFQAKGRAKVNSLVDEHIPDTVDVPAALGLGGAESFLPDSMKPPPINLAPVKAKIKTALYPIIDGITSKIADQASNFGAKQLHDADNQGGLNVHNAKGDHWKATGDHAMSKEEQNVKQAEQAVAASATHTKHIYDMSLSKKGEKDDGSPPQMPFLSMRPILDLLPMVDADNAPQQNWHWDQASPEYKAGIITNLKESIKGTIESASDAIKHQVQEAATGALQQAMAALGKVGQWLMQHLNALVAWIAEKMPTLPPEMFLNSLML